jgi:putative MFS transporter
MEDTFEELLDQFPVGFFHYKLFLICGLSFMCDAMEATLLSFLSNCAGDDWNLSNGQKATIISVVFAGRSKADDYGSSLHNDEYLRCHVFCF